MAKRQEIYSGTEIPAAAFALDEARLAAYLTNRLEGFRTPFTIEKFRGGQSNPTYKITTPAQVFVLRRKPAGALVASAHAIDREYRAIAAFHAAGFPVPRPYLYCDDDSVIGAAFYIAAFVEGRVFWDAELPDLTPTERTAIYEAMNDGLARLHSFDVAALGLENFGKAEGYLSRNLARWSRQYEAAQLAPLPDMDWLITTLQDRLPESKTTAVLHGDYGLYNIIFHPTKPEILAVLDWEMATLGDPLVDLAHNTRPWWTPPDRETAAATSLVDLDLDALGIPRLDPYIDHYLAASGQPDFANRAYYLAFAQFRVAAMIQGILKRAALGTASGKILHRPEHVAALAALARHTLETA